MNNLKVLLDEFLSIWSIDNVKEMTLQEYVGLGNRDTFCQWVETRTRVLGSIKGMTSIKFGIYERNPNKKRPVNYKNDEKYSWMKNYGNDRVTAFHNIRNDIVRIIEFTELGKFSRIDDIQLPDLFKWKVAFLYSNERLIPIYKRDVLFKIANHFGLKTNRHTRISEIQNLMMMNKPVHLDVYSFMQELYDQFSRDKDNKYEDKSNNETKERRTRRSTCDRNTSTQTRTINCKHSLYSVLN